MSRKTLMFSATDTLFFRESRPMESMGELQSVFPPPVRTLAGSVRTLIGEQKNVNWQTFDDAKGNDPVADLIGYGEDLGRLNFQGAWLTLDGKRLYPAPLLLMQKEEQLFRLELEKQGTWCDLGKKVRFPSLPDDAKGSQTLENTWLTKAGFEAVLQQETPDPNDILRATNLFKNESRVGIARDNSTRAVEPGLLYQTRHIRPDSKVSIELDAEGIPDDLPEHSVIRLGGEGRTASLKIAQHSEAFLKAPEAANAKGLVLYLLTPLLQQHNQETWQPLPGFMREEREKLTVWTGVLNDIELELHAGIAGKALREGGWDMAKHEPRAVRSLIPAGSVFFCKVKGSMTAAINALHDKQIGDLTAYGYGHLAVGIWKD